jgi:hypothetical protein
VLNPLLIQCYSRENLHKQLLVKLIFIHMSTILSFISFRATSALRLKFEVCKELKNHLELLPKTAYIQAQSQFSAQLKFLPRCVKVAPSCSLQ